MPSRAQSTQISERKASYAQFIQADSVVLDIGANVGRYSVRLATIARCGVVIAFEPMADARRILQYVLTQFQLRNVKVLPWALSHESSKVQMTAPVSNDIIGYNAGLAHISLDGVTEGNVSFIADVRRYDELGLDIGKVDFIKCDVEGVELNVFKGMNEMLQRDRPTILVEIESRHTERFGYSPNDVQRYLEEMGYRMHVVHDDKVTPSYEVNEGEKNYFFIPC